jgi:hypothetical protein
VIVSAILNPDGVAARSHAAGWRRKAARPSRRPPANARLAAEPMSALLEVRGLRVFGGVIAVDNKTFRRRGRSSVHRSERRGQDDPYQAPTGYLPRSTVVFDDRDLAAMALHKRARLDLFGPSSPSNLRRSDRARQPAGRSEPAHVVVVARRPRCTAVARRRVRIDGACLSAHRRRRRAAA